jgi:hypothetical protein
MTMHNVNTWVRQLNGELNIMELTTNRYKKVESDFVKEYQVSLTTELKCQMSLTNGKGFNKRKPNLRLTFSQNTNRLIKAEVFYGTK